MRCCWCSPGSVCSWDSVPCPSTNRKKNTGLPRAVTYCCHFPSLSRLCSHVAAQFPKTCSCSLTWNSGIFISASTKWLHNHSVGFTHPLISVKCHCSCSGVVIRVWLFLAGQGVLQESCFSLASPVRTHGFCVCLLCLCFHHSFWAVNGSKDCQFFEFRHKFASASRSCLPGSQWGMCYVRTGETAQYWTPTSKWRERQKPVWKILLCKLPPPPRLLSPTDLPKYDSLRCCPEGCKKLWGARMCTDPPKKADSPFLKELTSPWHQDTWANPDKVGIDSQSARLIQNLPRTVISTCQESRTTKQAPLKSPV